MANRRFNSPVSRTSPGAAICLSLVCLVAPAHSAAPPAGSDRPAAQQLSQVDRLIADAEAAEKTGNINLAIIEFKNAALLQPQNGEIRAKLGIALLRGGQAVNAERELRQAEKDHAPREVVVPAILDVMLERKETKELLTQFPEPAAGAEDRTTPYVMLARASALQMQAQPKDARAAMNRALMLRRDANTLTASAGLAQQQGDMPLAMSQADEAVRLSPTNEPAWTLKIELTGRSGDLKQALAEVDDFARRLPDSTIARVIRIEVLLAMKDEARAKDAVETLIKQQPKSLYGQYFKAILSAQSHDYTGAWRLAQTLPVGFVQSRPGIAKIVAGIALASGNAETGGAILTRLISRQPDDRAARLQLATIRLSQKEPQAALDALEPLKNSDDAATHAVLAQAYLALGRFNDAITSLEVASSAPHANPTLARELAVLELRAGDGDRAVEELRDAVARDPGNLPLSGSLIGALGLAGRFDDALALATQLAQRAPDSPLPPFYRGQILVARGDIAGAVREFSKSLSHDATFLPALYYRANAEAAQGDFEPAKKDMRLLAAKDPAGWAAWSRLIQIAVATGQQQDVQGLFDQAIKAAPKSLTPRLAFVNYLMTRGQLADAQNAVTEVLRGTPDNPDALVLEGRIQLSRGQPQDAVKTFRIVTDGKYSSPGAYDQLARALYAAKDASGAEVAAAKAADLAPNSPDVRQVLIDTEIAEGKTDAALATAGIYARANPGSDADLLTAYTLQRANRPADAEMLLEKSLAANPDDRVALRLSAIATRSGDMKKAKAVLEQWVATKPSDTGMRRQYAGLLMATGDNSGARVQYETLLKQQPNDVIALDNLASLLQKEDSARALSLAVHAAKLAPASAEIADTVGWIRFQRGDQQGALAVLQRAYNLHAANPAISYHYAVALRASGKQAEAKSLLQSVLAKNPKFDGADEARQTLARW